MHSFSSWFFHKSKLVTVSEGDWDYLTQLQSSLATWDETEGVGPERSKCGAWLIVEKFC